MFAGVNSGKPDDMCRMWRQNLYSLQLLSTVSNSFKDMFSVEADFNVSLRQSGHVSAPKWEQEAFKTLSTKQANTAGMTIWSSENMRSNEGQHGHRFLPLDRTATNRKALPVLTFGLHCDFWIAIWLRNVSEDPNAQGHGASKFQNLRFRKAL